MNSNLHNKSLTVMNGMAFGIITGVVVGAILGEIGGYVERMAHMMNTHDYQVARQIHGDFVAFILNSGIALDRALLFASFSGVIAAATGAVVGIVVSLVGMNSRFGIEWVLVSIIGIAPILVLLLIGYNPPWFYFLLIASPVIGNWLVVRLIMRLYGLRLPEYQIQRRIWIGYVIAAVLIMIITYMFMGLFALITRV